MNLDSSVREFLIEVAAPEPSVTGGGVNAVTVAAAAGLVTMVAKLSTAMPDAESVAQRSEDFRADAMKLADADGEAYTAVLLAQRMPTDHPDRRASLSAALAEAAQPPLRLAELAAELTTLAADVAARGKKPLRGDAITAANLAAAATRASTTLARINLTAAGRGWDPDNPAEHAAATAQRDAAAATATLDG